MREQVVSCLGQQPDPSTGANMTPIYLSSTYAQAGPGEHLGFEYSRTQNPTRSTLEANLAALEGGSFGLAFASGCAATATVLHLLKSGDHVVAGDDLYGGTFRLFEHVFRADGIDVTYVDARIPERVASALRPASRLCWIETPTNPMLNLADIAGIAAICRPRGVLLAVDNLLGSDDLISLRTRGMWGPRERRALPRTEPGRTAEGVPAGPGGSA